MIDVNDVKEVCLYCKGAGIIKFSSTIEDLGTICSCCRGKGYMKVDPTIIANICEQEPNVYRLRNIYRRSRNVQVFTGKVIDYNIQYVAFANRGTLGSSRGCYEGDFELGKVITYKEYLEGKYPLPDESILCPKTLGNYPFDGLSDNNCYLECTSNQKVKCWQEFYGDDDKQEVLDKKIRTLKPRVIKW